VTTDSSMRTTRMWRMRTDEWPDANVDGDTWRTSAATAMIVNVNAVTQDGITPTANQRTDKRAASPFCFGG
jgi:hypothetical protein